MEIEDFAGNEELMEYLENSPDYHVGEPLRLCKACHASVVRNRDEISEEAQAIERDRWRFQMALRFGCGLMGTP